MCKTPCLDQHCGKCSADYAEWLAANQSGSHEDHQLAALELGVFGEIFPCDAQDERELAHPPALADPYVSGPSA